MISWLQHSPRLRRAPSLTARPVLANAPPICVDYDYTPQAPPKRRSHVSPTAPAAHRLYISVTPYSSWNVMPDPMRGR
jgi:hypothetical protein